MRVVVTRESGHNKTLASWLPGGSTLIEVPLTTTRFYDASEVQRALRACEHYGAFRAIVVTSARSALYVALAREGMMEGGSVLSVGEATARALDDVDAEVDAVGRGGALELAPTIEEGPVLLLGAATMREELPEALKERGIEVTMLACYETVSSVLTSQQVSSIRQANVIFIGAPSAWLVARDFVSEGTWVVVPGTTTGDVVRLHHERVIVRWGPELREHLLGL